MLYSAATRSDYYNNNTSNSNDILNKNIIDNCRTPSGIKINHDFSSVEINEENNINNNNYNNLENKSEIFGTKAIFRAIGLPDVIKYDDFLHDSSSYAVQIADTDLSYLRRCGYKKPFYSLERGVKTCLYNHLKSQ